MTESEFVRIAVLRGLALKETAQEYAKGRTVLTDADLEAVYRYQEGKDAASRGSPLMRDYQGARCTKRMKWTEQMEG